VNIINYLSFEDRDNLQSVLYWIASVFLFFYSIILTLAPAVRYHRWNVSYRWEHWVGFVVCVVSYIIINRLSQEKMSNRDPYLLPVVGFLMGIGLLTIFRLNVNFGWRQSIWLALSTCLILFCIQKSHWLQKIRFYKYVWLLLGLFLTALTFILGIYPSGNGPQLWLSFGGFFMQPSEPLKILLIIYLSAYLADQWPSRQNLPTLIVPTIIVILAALLILVGQRDLGTASIFIFIYAFYMYLVSGKRRTLFLFAVFLLLAGIIGYQLFDVIKIRVDSWLYPWLDPGGNSYQVIQSIQAMAAGRLLGSGPGIGSPGLVPVAVSDFIFAAITEELGLIGALGIFCLYIFIAYRGIIISLKATNQYQQLLAAGITVLFSAQSMLILGGNTRLLPLTGVTLPFVSYGGSSLMTSAFGIILLLWVSQQTGTKTLSKSEVLPYVFTFKTIILGFTALSLATGWWAIIRSDNLLSRPDNLRRIINDRYVLRGSILDRQNNPIAITVGEISNYSRYINEPSLSSTIGYINPVYGLGGIEFSMDGYLRGIEGIPSFSTAMNNLLYSQPPPGLDLRTSIDINIQSKLINSLQNFHGAAIVMNPKTGEILGLWTSPTFNSNQLEVRWETWIKDPQSPLVNRVTQGHYPIGSLITPFLLTYKSVDESKLLSDENPLGCAISIPTTFSTDMSKLIQNGCNRIMNNSINQLPENEIMNFLSSFGWTETFAFELPQNEPLEPSGEISLEYLKSELFLSPLQVARSAAIFSQSGIIPYPRIGMAVNTPSQGWIVLASKESKKVIGAENAIGVGTLMSRMDIPVWDLVSNVNQDKLHISWFVSGTLPEWQSTPIVFVLVLEDSQPQIARINGRKLMGELTNVIP